MARRREVPRFIDTRRELPVLPAGEPVCPAGERVDGASPGRAGCVCRLMQADVAAEAGIRMSAGALGHLREQEGMTFLKVSTDAATVLRFCFGDALPVVDSRSGKGRNSYTYCPVWQAAREREWAAKAGLTDPEPEPESVSMGVEPRAVSSVEDPWAARRELDVLAPPKSGDGAR